MKKIFFLIIVVSTFFYSCSQADNSAINKEMEYSSKMSSSDSYQQADSPATANNKAKLPQVSPHIPLALSERKIIRNADISMEVKDMESSLFQIQMSTEGRGGYISGMNMQKEYRKITNDLIIKVPGSELNNLLQDIEKESITIDYRKINSQDVTEEMVDIEARLQTKRDVHARYTKILRTQAKSIEEVIYAEEQIRKLTEEIEAKEGRLNYLRHQTSLSTLRVKLHQKIDYEPTTVSVAAVPSFFDTFTGNVSMGWNGILGVFLELIKLWPFWVFFGVLYFRRKSIFRRFRI